MAAAEVAAAVAAAEATRHAGARGGAGRGGGGAEVARPGGPCRPCLGCGPGRAIGGRPGAAARLSLSLAVAAAAKGPRLGRAGPVTARSPHPRPPFL